MVSLMVFMQVTTGVMTNDAPLCRASYQLGSHIVGRTCRPRQDWARIDRATQATLELNRSPQESTLNTGR